MQLFIDSTNKGARYLKLEFNPEKLGRKGIQKLADWYNETLVHYPFEDVCRDPTAIQRLDVALDVYGVHISDLIIPGIKGYKSKEWRSEQGLLETHYPFSSPGKQSDFKVYDKLEELRERRRYSKRLKKKTVYEREFLEGEWPITRIEKSIKRPRASINNGRRQGRFDT